MQCELTHKDAPQHHGSMQTDAPWHHNVPQHHNATWPDNDDATTTFPLSLSVQTRCALWYPNSVFMPISLPAIFAPSNHFSYMVEVGGIW